MKGGAEFLLISFFTLHSVAALRRTEQVDEDERQVVEV